GLAEHPAVEARIADLDVAGRGAADRDAGLLEELGHGLLGAGVLRGAERLRERAEVVAQRADGVPETLRAPGGAALAAAVLRRHRRHPFQCPGTSDRARRDSCRGAWR